jgi:hypothetical protein
MQKFRNWAKTITALSFLVMISVRVFGDIFKMNGNTVKQLFQSYPNLYSPADYAFSIWILIYLLQAGFVLYQLGVFGRDKCKIEPDSLYRISILFIISSLLCTAWNIAFHYNYLALSLVIIIMVTISNITAVSITSAEELSRQDILLIRLPIGIFGAWSLISTILTFVVLLVSIGWQGYGFFCSIMAVVLIIAGTAVGAAVLIRYKNIAFGLTLVWGYAGILVRQLSDSGLQHQFPQVIAAAGISAAVLLVLSACQISAHLRKP